MVLHLLGKKSWNVYNTDNVERVRRDEAEARAREEARDDRMQEEDAARRLAILRGEEPSPLCEESEEVVIEAGGERERNHPRKRRRVRGEDDTDRDIRYAQEDAYAGEKAKQALTQPSQGHDAPLLDHAGHLQLIPAPDEKAIRKAEKNAEVEAEKGKKRKREEDQYTMRFSNAAGFNSNMQKPWYAASRAASGDQQQSKAVVLANVEEKNVWGNEDPRRKEREFGRIAQNDPFAAMRQAQTQLKQSERDKANWSREREAELEEVKRIERRKSRHEKRRRRRDDSVGSLEGFSLDKPLLSAQDRGDHHKP